ncbi:MAG: SRPBCC family protein [Actinomycetia bacterium]|nr:SRPBCC family protein [Actinomycetes bacterium]
MSDTTEWPTTGSASITIDASPAEAYAFVTDLDKLPLLSPENVRCEFTGDSTTIGEGATFKGHNKNGDYEWSADCLVKVAEPGRQFSFLVPPGWEYATTWSYRFEPEGDGVRVTESFDSPMLGDPEIYPGKLEGRCGQLQAACEVTLANLKTALES